MLKLQSFCNFLFFSYVFLVAFARSVEGSSRYDERDFICDLDGGDYPTTVIVYKLNERKIEEQPLISWRASLGSYSPQERCIAVSQRFQALMSTSGEEMEAIVSGFVNGSPAICAAEDSDGRCTNDTLLFTVRNQEHLERMVSRLETRIESSLGGSASYGPISQSNGSIYLDLMDLLEDDNINFLGEALFDIED